LAAKIADSTRPTFYLDQSTLCEAFLAVSLPGSRRASDPAYRRLLPCIERVATNANLCLSIIHLLELAAWSDIAAADGIATWLDALPVVWMQKVDTILSDEAEYWLKASIGLSPPPVQPFAPSMWGVFERWTPAESAIAIEHSSVPGAVQIFREMNHTGGSDLSRAAAQVFRADRQRFGHWSDTQKMERFEYNWRVDLRKLAREVHRTLESRGDAEYNASGRTSGDVMESFVEFVESSATALPARKVMRVFTQGFADVAARRTEGSRQDRELASSVNDGQHAALGVYCDVFTCDQLTSRMLGDIRTQLGRQRQLSAGDIGSPEMFVETLLRTLP